MTRIFWIVVVFLFGCSGDAPPLPAAQPLMAAEHQLATLPGYEVGSYSPQVIDDLVLHAPELDNRELVLRVWYPASADGDVPVVIFSHGNWSDRNKYDNLLRHWASYGYAVIAPTHLDGRGMARGIFNSLRYGQLGLISARVDDVRYVMDRLPEIERQVGQAVGAPVRFRKQQLVIAGHSFGAFTAQQFAGAQAWDITASDRSPAAVLVDPRVVGVIAISPPGPMFDVIHDKSWLQMRGPVLVTTGTWDSNAQFWPDWKMHLMSHETAPEGEQFALVVEGADHYLGNLICRPERDAEPQHDALAFVNSASVAFLNTYLRADGAAEAYLQSDDLQSVTKGFARLLRR